MACLSVLNGISLDCNTGQGGIRTVYIAPFEDVETKTLTDNVISAITMKASAKFKEFQVRKQTSALTSTRTLDDANGINFVTSDLVLKFAKQDTAKRLEMESLCKGRFVAITLDNNGLYQFLGFDNYLVATAASSTSGTATSDANGYDITIQDLSSEYPYEVSSTIVGALIG